MMSTQAAAPVDAADLGSAVEAVREAGLRPVGRSRPSAGRLWDAPEPLTAEQLSDQVGASSDAASIYRNLEAFERLGLIRHFHLGHGPGLYARSSLAAREYLLCEACGAHLSVESSDLDEVRDLIRNRFGYRARFNHFPSQGSARAARARPREARWTSRSCSNRWRSSTSR